MKKPDDFNAIVFAIRVLSYQGRIEYASEWLAKYLSKSNEI
jgi:hypothetical protein